jgi:hypothetical protein
VSTEGVEASLRLVRLAQDVGLRVAQVAPEWFWVGLVECRRRRECRRGFCCAHLAASLWLGWAAAGR